MCRRPQQHLGPRHTLTHTHRWFTTRDFMHGLMYALWITYLQKGKHGTVFKQSPAKLNVCRAARYGFTVFFCESFLKAVYCTSQRLCKQRAVRNGVFDWLIDWWMDWLMVFIMVFKSKHIRGNQALRKCTQPQTMTQCQEEIVAMRKK